VPKSGEYLRYAAECVRLATRTGDQNEKVHLLTVAERWRELAARVETTEKRAEAKGLDERASRRRDALIRR
jgi:hypothetical protein